MQASCLRSQRRVSALNNKETCFAGAFNAGKLSACRTTALPAPAAYLGAKSINCKYCVSITSPHKNATSPAMAR